jgi:hypothetical protein
MHFQHQRIPSATGRREIDHAVRQVRQQRTIALAQMPQTAGARGMHSRRSVEIERQMDEQRRERKDGQHDTDDFEHLTAASRERRD